MRHSDSHPVEHGLAWLRVQDRKVGFSESGRLQVDVKLASFATRARGRVQQVSHTPLLQGVLG